VSGKFSLEKKVEGPMTVGVVIFDFLEMVVHFSKVTYESFSRNKFAPIYVFWWITLNIFYAPLCGTFLHPFFRKRFVWYKVFFSPYFF